MLANLYGSWPDEALLFGVPDITDDQGEMYRAVIDHLVARLDSGGNWARIPPQGVPADEAPCKAVRLTGDYFDDTLAASQDYCAEAGGHFLAPFNDADVVEGQARLCYLFLRACVDRPSAPLVEAE